MAFLDTQRHSTVHHPRTSGGVLSFFARMHDVWQQRRALQNLGADALKDIGISRQDALKESHRPVWDVPATWRD